MSETQWRVRFTAPAAQDLQSLDHMVSRVRRKLEWLQEAGGQVKLQPLRANLSGYYKLRVGDLRIILRREPETRVFLVMAIAHRRHVYKRVLDRLK